MKRRLLLSFEMNFQLESNFFLLSLFKINNRFLFFLFHLDEKINKLETIKNKYINDQLNDN